MPPQAELAPLVEQTTAEVRWENERVIRAAREVEAARLKAIRSSERPQVPLAQICRAIVREYREAARRLGIRWSRAGSGPAPALAETLRVE